MIEKSPFSILNIDLFNAVSSKKPMLVLFWSLSRMTISMKMKKSLMEGTSLNGAKYQQKCLML